MKKLLVALLAVICLASCNDNSFKINVNLKNSDGKTVYLKHYVNEEIETLNSLVAKNDKVVFKVQKGENLDSYLIDIDGWKRPLAIFTENQDVMITGDCQNYNKISVKSGPKQDELNAFVEEFDKIEDETDAMYFAMRLVKENRDNVLGAYTLYRYKWAFSLEDLYKLIDSFEGEARNSGYTKIMKNYIVRLESVSVGHKYIDFKQEKSDGEMIALSEFVGNNELLMIDFWASWCPDCRKENPNVVAVYNAFKDKGFDIVSVSLDTDKAAWEKAIVDDNLSWENHVSDLKGWENKAAALYSIAFIPQNVIINKDGVIVARNLNGEDLMNFVSDCLK
ncbi:MAG: AhpC/TSA family protein [Bacteroidales bacterium]|nr:AhpC/TSA family protein [Bacteroidales bacterium]